SGALFRWLHRSKAFAERADGAFDIVVTNEPTERASHVLGTLTPFGADGPWVDRPATEFTLQAWAGATGSRGYPDGPPIAVGGRLGEWVAATYPTVGALAALRRTEGTHVDVGLLDCVAVTMAMMPSIFASMSG